MKNANPVLAVQNDEELSVVIAIEIPNQACLNTTPSLEDWELYFIHESRTAIKNSYKNRIMANSNVAIIFAQKYNGELVSSTWEKYGVTDVLKLQLQFPNEADYKNYVKIFKALFS